MENTINGSSSHCVTAAPMDLYESAAGDAMIVEIDLPGVQEGDISVQLKDSTLEIVAKRERRGEGESCCGTEASNTEYRRTLKLTSGLDGSKIEASLRDGVLRLTLPKSEQLKPKQIPIKIN